MNEITSINQLTALRKSALIATAECDSINSRDSIFRLQTLNWLANHDLLEAFDSEHDWRKGHNREYVWFCLTPKGQRLIEASTR